MARSPETRDEIVALAKAGVDRRVIAKKYNTTPAAVGGLLYRAISDDVPCPQTLGPHGNMRNAPVHRFVDLPPAKYPYAADSSCPDFAWDDEHCAAVIDQGGFAALNLKPVRKRA